VLLREHRVARHKARDDQRAFDQHRDEDDRLQLDAVLEIEEDFPRRGFDVAAALRAGFMLMLLLARRAGGSLRKSTGTDIEHDFPSG
jgi:hypothetical protein